MSAKPSVFIGNIPLHHDNGLGPHILTDYADRLARKSCEGSPSNAVGLAAGTGIVSRILRDCLPRDTMLPVTDLNAPMLDVARSKFGGDDDVGFSVADTLIAGFRTRVGPGDMTIPLSATTFVCRAT